MKTVSCSEVMQNNCKTVIEGRDANEVMTKAAEHARKDHGVTQVTPDMTAKVRSAIRDK